MTDNNEFFTPEQAQLYDEAVAAGSAMSPLEFLAFLERDEDNEEIIEQFKEARSAGYPGTLNEFLEMKK